MQTSNTDAISFYTKHGFEQGEMLENYYKRIVPPHCLLGLSSRARAHGASVELGSARAPAGWVRRATTAKGESEPAKHFHAVEDQGGGGRVASWRLHVATRPPRGKDNTRGLLPSP